MLRYIDSLGDHYPSADIALKWTVKNDPFSDMSIATGGRNSGKCLKMNPANQCYVAKTIDSQSTWTIGVAVQLGSIGVAQDLFGVMDAGTIQVSVHINVDGTLSVIRGGAGGTVLGTSSASLLATTYYYLELKVVINNSTGSHDLHINGVSATSGSSENTRQTANASANQVFLGNTGTNAGGPAVQYDDLYAADAQSGLVTTFLGDCRVECLFPTGNGSVNNFTATGAGANWQCVDQTSQDGDATYVADGTAGDEDNYAFGSLASTAGSVYGVQSVLCAKNDTAGTKTIAAMYKSGATDTAGASVNIASTSYVYYTEIKENNPTTAVAWTISDVNAANFGVKIIA